MSQNGLRLHNMIIPFHALPISREETDFKLNEDEFNYLDTYFKAKSNVISAETQDKLLVIYNRVFHENKQATNCSSCFRNELHNKLERVYIEYLKEN